jgi:phage gpG-like protein
MAQRFSFRSKIKPVGEKIAEGVSAGIREAAFAVEDQAKMNVQNVGAIDTGALRSSIYTQTDQSNDRGSAIAQAQARNPSVSSGEISTFVPDRFSARVGVAVEYGIYVEMGVAGSAFGNMPARPYLTPAAEQIGQQLDEIVKAAIRRRL